MSVIFMTSENSKITDGHRLRRNLTNKMNLRRGDKRVALSDLSTYYTWENIKEIVQKIMNLKYQEQRGMKSLNCLMDLILY